MDAINQRLIQRYHDKQYLSGIAALVLGLFAAPWWTVLIPAAWFFGTSSLETPPSARGKPVLTGFAYLVMFAWCMAVCLGVWWLGSKIPSLFSD